MTSETNERDWIRRIRFRSAVGCYWQGLVCKTAGNGRVQRHAMTAEEPPSMSKHSSRCPDLWVALCAAELFFLLIEAGSHFIIDRLVPSQCTTMF